MRVVIIVTSRRVRLSLSTCFIYNLPTTLILTIYTIIEREFNNKREQSDTIAVHFNLSISLKMSDIEAKYNINNEQKII